MSILLIIWYFELWIIDTFIFRQNNFIVGWLGLKQMIQTLWSRSMTIDTITFTFDTFDTILVWNNTDWQAAFRSMYQKILWLLFYCSSSMVRNKKFDSVANNFFDTLVDTNNNNPWSDSLIRVRRFLSRFHFYWLTLLVW